MIAFVPGTKWRVPGMDVLVIDDVLPRMGVTEEVRWHWRGGSKKTTTPEELVKIARDAVEVK